MRSPVSLSKAVFICWFCAACAYVTAVPTSPNNPVEGIPIPTVKPMLFVSNGQATILNVPNPNRAYALRYGAFLAKHDLTLELQNHMLAKLTSNQDSTAVPIALINLATKAIEKGAVGLSEQTNETNPGENFQLFDIIFSDDGDFIGVRPVLYGSDFVHISQIVKRTTTKTKPGPNVVKGPQVKETQKQKSDPQ